MRIRQIGEKPFGWTAHVAAHQSTSSPSCTEDGPPLGLKPSLLGEAMAIASRLECIATKVEAIASRLEAIAVRLKACGYLASSSRTC